MHLMIIIIIIIGSTAMGGLRPSQANVASDFYHGHPPANFYNLNSLRLPLLRQSFLISFGDVLVDLQRLSTIVNAFKRNMSLITFRPRK
jgi:hypothetical protein